VLRLPPALVAGLFEPAWDLWEGSVRLRTYRRLLESQWWDRERLEELRRDRLARLVRHAAETSPFHRRRLAEAGVDPAAIREPADLARLPVMTKAEVRSSLDEIVSTAYPRRRLVRARTGGSTGVSLEVYCDVRGGQLRNGAALRADSWSGWRLGEPMAAVWGNPRPVRGLRQRLRRLLKDRVFFLDTMRIDGPAIDRFVADWRRWRPGLLYGHAHSLYILAEELRARGIALRPRGVVATSMMLMQPEREVIERVFGVPVTNRYGCEEVSQIACECELHAGLHLNAEHVIVEFLRDDGSPCAPGEDGRIVVTELVNLGMPMIRYEVGDRGVPAAAPCPCGRGLPLMASVTGRSADFLLAEDGSRVAGISLIENTLTRVAGIRQMQMVQDEPCRLVVNLVPAEGYGPRTAAELTEILRGALGAGFAVDVRQVDRIAQERSGKYRFSICNVRPGT
jgi:phenylacetate-CoA ligase